MAKIQKTKTAVILAAGTGNRLDVFETPKPLVKVAGQPLITHTIQRLKQAGIKKIYIIALNNEALIRKELVNYPPGLKIKFINNKTKLPGMLGSVLSIQDEIKQPFFITMSDLVFTKNPYLLFKHDQLPQDTISILLSNHPEINTLCGANAKVVYQNKKIIQIGLGNKVKSPNALEAGIYHFTPNSFKKFSQLALQKKLKTWTRRVEKILEFIKKNKNCT